MCYHCAIAYYVHCWNANIKIIIILNEFIISQAHHYTRYLAVTHATLGHGPESPVCIAEGDVCVAPKSKARSRIDRKVYCCKVALALMGINVSILIVYYSRQVNDRCKESVDSFLKFFFKNSAKKRKKQPHSLTLKTKKRRKLLIYSVCLLSLHLILI